VTAVDVAAPSARGPGDPAPDTSDYRIVHRAMRVDLHRLAAVAGQLVERPDPQRLRLLRWYLGGMSAEIRNHHTVEDDHVWPLLASLGAGADLLEQLVDDHERLDGLLARAEVLASAPAATPELETVLGELATFIAGHVDQEDREVLPRLEQHVSVEDYAALQRHFRGSLSPRLLPFVVPWATSHATTEELAGLLATAGAPMRLVLRVFGARFRARRRLLLAPPAATRRDRRLVVVMRTLSRAHVAVFRATGGRIGGRWLGGSDAVLLTVRGRRTGALHTVTLMGLRDEDDLLVAASQGGVDHEPQWWLNLQADPHAEVEVRGERRRVRAERVGDEERPEIWARFVAAYDGFATYQARVRRQIAVVRLRPEPDGGDGAEDLSRRSGARTRSARGASG